MCVPKYLQRVYKINFMNKFLGKLLLFFLLLETPSLSDKIDNIKILGNERISKETILMFSDISLNDKIMTKKSTKY